MKIMDPPQQKKRYECTYSIDRHQRSVSVHFMINQVRAVKSCAIVFSVKYSDVFTSVALALAAVVITLTIWSCPEHIKSTLNGH